MASNRCLSASGFGGAAERDLGVLRLCVGQAQTHFRDRNPELAPSADLARGLFA